MSERSVWFITRPERDPKFHRDALLALKDATNNFKIKWAANREAHKLFEQKLFQRGVKRENISNDGSGGRTWAAMLKTFSYCYVDDDGYIVPTKVGRNIMEGINVYQNIKKQILTFQIPNAYFLETGFRPKFEEGFAVRPARFLIKLCCRPDLDYHLTKEEITFFVLTAKNDSDLDLIAEKIKRFRSVSEGEREIIKESTASSFDHRERSDKAARDFETAHSDVAHTFMLICSYTGLVEYARGRALRVNPANANNVIEEIMMWDERYPFNKRYLISLQRMAENNGLDIDSYKASEYKGIKPATNKRKTQQKVMRLLQAYPQPAEMSVEELTSILGRELPPQEAEDAAAYIKSTDSLSSISNDFVEAYLSEENNLVFEDKTGSLLKAVGFEVEMRPKIKGCSTEIEIILKYESNKCGIIDCKNYKEKFPLSSSLSSLMYGEYIPNYDGYDGREIEFFGYITASAFSGEKNIEKISRRVKTHIPGREIKGIMINARTLLGFLDYCIEAGLSKDQRVKLFLTSINNHAYPTTEQMLKVCVQ